MKNINIINSLSDIVNDYNLFLVDLWGVIHDGESLYSESKNAIKYLKECNKNVVFISNAPRRSSHVINSLSTLGVDRELYNKVITSGEITFDYINSHYQSKKYYIVNSEEIDLLEGSDLTRTNNLEEADFILLIGFENYGQTLSDMLPFLDKSLKYGKKIICANPDKTVTDIQGNIYLCAGIIAEKYQQMGGEVIFFGKPYKDIYAEALSLFSDIDKRNIVAIGDNIDTDIKGANNNCVDSYLIAGGIHANSLFISHGEIPSEEKYQSFFNKKNIYPTGMIGCFKA